MPQEITNALRKLTASLDSAKVRRQEGLFVAEGTKCVLDLIGHFPLAYLFVTSGWLDANKNKLPRDVVPCLAKKSDMERMTHFSTAPEIIALFNIPEYKLDMAQITTNISVGLDCIQDPGNLGTIIRTADWFGIRQIICSPDTVDVFNPKVVQATMGALARVKVIYMPLDALIDSLSDDTSVCGTFLDGEDIYASRRLPSAGLLVMGNEGKGISDSVGRRVNHRLLIPSYPPGVSTSESLNVAVATAITLAELRRRKLS